MSEAQNPAHEYSESSRSASPARSPSPTPATIPLTQIPAPPPFVREVKKKPQNPNSVQRGEDSVTGEHQIQHRRLRQEQGQQGQQEVQKQEGGTVKKRDQVSLRLDINLEVEVTVKARIQGDLTLTLL
jgi:hypothetical protein